MADVAGMDTEGLQRTLGELLAANEKTQANFDEIRQQFPIQPDNVAASIPDWTELEEGGLRPPNPGEGEPESFAEQLGILGLLEAFTNVLWVEVGAGGAILRGGAGLTVEHPEKGVYKVWLQTATQESFDYPGDIRECISGTAGGFQATNANVNLIESAKGVLGYEIRLVENVANSTLANADFVFLAASLGTEGALAGAEGPAGPTHKTLYHGEGAPSAELGEIDDFYIDTTGSKIYGPKGVEGWGGGASLVGPQGKEGPEGKEGKGGQSGFRYTYLTNTELTDPGAGKLKFNAVLGAGANVMRISETDKDGNALAAVLATLDDSTNSVKGTIILRKEGSPNVFAVFQVSGALTDEGTFDKISVTYVTSSGLANGDEVVLQFYRAGDKGPNVLLESEDVIEWKQESKTLREKIRGFYDGVSHIIEAVAGVGEEAALVASLIITGGGTKALSRVRAVVGAISKTIIDGEEKSSFLQLGTVGKIRDWGLVTELPKEPVKGDRCKYIADKTNGIIWDLVYDGEGESPWKFMGGPPLWAEVETPQGTKAPHTTFQDLATVGPAITVPLKGDYDIEVGCRAWSGTVAQESFMSYQVGATAVVQEDGAFQRQAQTASLVIGSVARPKRKTAIASGAKITAKYRSATENEANFSVRWMRIIPVRVG